MKDFTEKELFRKCSIYNNYKITHLIIKRALNIYKTHTHQF